MRQIYTVEAAAREIGLSANHLFNLSVVGQGPKVRRVEEKGRPFYLAEDLHEWLRSRPIIKPVVVESLDRNLSKGVSP